MIAVRRGDERGHTRIDWLDSRHTFSFDRYHDPRHMGFRSLRVVNEDRVAPGRGFGTHPHRDMEILTWVLSGSLEHRDSLGTGSIIAPGDVQRMSAGTGVTHSEWNHSSSEPVHFLQIWLLPERAGLAPGYEQRALRQDLQPGTLRLVTARDGREGAVRVHQDADLWATVLEPEQSVTHRLAPGRSAWVQVARGAVSLDGTRLVAGDGAAVTDVGSLCLAADAPSEVLLFDLA
jgi:redox-sensitive bicupin YhaK (pirin superfamily)